MLMPVRTLAPTGAKPSTSARSPLLDGLMAWWALGEASGSRADSHTAAVTLTDNNTVMQAVGIKGNAALFVSTNLEWLSSTATTFSLTGDFTVSTWVYPVVLAGAATYGRGVLAYHNTVIGDWMIALQADGRVTCYHWRVSGADGTGRHTTTPAPIITGAWFHIVFRRSGSTYSIWVNGASAAFTNGSTDAGWGSAKLQLGRLFPDETYHYNGRMDETAVWSVALTDAQIASLYNGGSGMTYPG